MQKERPSGPVPLRQAIAEAMVRIEAARQDPDLQARLRAAAEDERRQRLREAVLEARATSELIPRFLDRTFATFNAHEGTSEAVSAALAVVEDPRRGLALYGDVGVGKTHLAHAICNAAVERGVVCIFTTMHGLLDRLRASNMRGSTETYLSIQHHLNAAPILVLDDFGKETPSNTTDWTLTAFANFINLRYESNKPLIVTSNLGPRRLGAHYQGLQIGDDAYTMPSMFRRVLEMTGGPQSWILVSSPTERA